MGQGLRTENRVSEMRTGIRGGKPEGQRGSGLAWPYLGSSWTLAGEASPASGPGPREGRTAPQRQRESQPVLQEPKGSIGALRTASPLFPRGPASGSPTQKRAASYRLGSRGILNLVSQHSEAPPLRDAHSRFVLRSSLRSWCGPQVSTHAKIEAAPPQWCPIVGFFPPQDCPSH